MSRRRPVAVPLAVALALLVPGGCGSQGLQPAGPTRELAPSEITALELAPIQPTFCAGDEVVPLRIVAVLTNGDRLVIDDRHADFAAGRTLEFTTTLGTVKAARYVPPKRRTLLAFHDDPQVRVALATNAEIAAVATLVPDWRCDVMLRLHGAVGEAGVNGEPSIDARTARDPDFVAGPGGTGGAGGDAPVVLVEVTDLETPRGRLGLVSVISQDPPLTLDGLFDPEGGHLIVDLDGGRGGPGGDGGAGGAGFSPGEPCHDPTAGSTGGRGGGGGPGGRGGEATFAIDRARPALADRVTVRHRGGDGGRGGVGGAGGAAGVGTAGDGCQARPAADGPRGRTGPAGRPGEDGGEPRTELRPRDALFPRGTSHLED